jgi:hypothetical protein
VIEFDPAAIVRTLNGHGVRFVLIGGVAAQVHDLPVPATVDIDVTPARDDANLHRLAEAFDDLDAGLYTADEGGTWFPRVPVQNWAQYDTLHLMTRFGPVDVVFAPDGAERGFDQLQPMAEPRQVGTEVALVISVSAWEHLKRAAGRQKDLAHLDAYYEGRQ